VSEAGTAVTGTVAVAPRWYAHRFNRAGVYRVATAVASALPRPVRLRVAAALAGVAGGRFPAERAVVRRNLASCRARRRASSTRSSPPSSVTSPSASPI